jgi:hypothetical protein
MTFGDRWFIKIIHNSLNSMLYTNNYRNYASPNIKSYTYKLYIIYNVDIQINKNQLHWTHFCAVYYKLMGKNIFNSGDLNKISPLKFAH